MWRRVSAVVLVCVVFAGCGGDASEPDGKITVFAATSLTGAFTDIGKAFEAAHPRTKVTFNFAASSALAQQMDEGNLPDVFASADRKNMRQRDSDVFAHNRLVIATKPNNPARIKTLADLAAAPGVVSLCASDVPCGSYAATALGKAGVTIEESRVTRAPNVAATLSAVTDGDAVAAIVYVTDAKAARARVRAVTIPAADNVIADYPIGVIKPSLRARAFVEFVLGDEAQRILLHYGFSAP